MSQSSQQRSETQTQSQPANEPPYKPGTIKSLKLINFMCHDSFELSLGPRVNFVIGPNGSGKSALLTALVVALGGRATTTCRAKRNDDLVMYGKKQAKIVVVLHNYDKIMNKDQGYKPDEYGKSIVVEKIIYKGENMPAKLILKNDKDKKVSERKQELDEILDHFGILINNPICILNQEVSKTFLHSKKPEDKFDLFMKATNLEQIEQDYLNAEKYHKSWEDGNNKKSAAFKLLDSEYASCKEKTGFLENRAKLNEERIQLNQKLIWAIIRDNEVLSEELNQKVQTISENIAKAEAEIEKREEKIKEHKNDIDVVRAELNGFQGQAEADRTKLQEIRFEESKVKTKQFEFKQKIESSKKKIGRYKEEIANLKKSIVDMKEKFRDQNALAHDNEQRKLEIDRLTRELSGDHAREKSIQLHNNQLHHSMVALKTDLSTSESRLSALRSKISTSNANLLRLKNGQENVLRRYGDHTMAIRDQIDQAFKQGRFKKKPVGPLGCYIKLKNPDVAAALEQHLGKTAHAFACDNNQDMATLNGIFQRFRAQRNDFRPPSIITRRFGPRHNVSRFRADHEDYLTLLDHIEIENDAVYNTLVDRTNLESVLFIPDYKDAEDLMINASLVPRNTRCAMTKDCCVMYPRTATGGYRAFSNSSHRYTLFSRNNDAQIKEIQRDIEITKTEIADLDHIIKGQRESLNAQRMEFDKNMKESERLIAATRKKEEDLLNLKTTMTREPQEISVLEAELEQSEKMIAKEKIDIEQHKEILETLDVELRSIAEKKEQCSTKLKIREDKRQELLKVIEGSRISIKEAETVIAQSKITIQNYTRDKREQSEKLDEALEKLARSKQNVTSQCARPAIIKKTEQIKEAIRKLETYLRVQEEEMQDPDELMQNLRKRMLEIENLANLKNSNELNFTRSSKSLEQRKEGFSNLRNNTIGAVSTTFTTVMRSMKMNGELQIYVDDLVHRGEIIKKAKTLEMRIDTNYTPSQRVNSVMSDANNNSNGNRRVSRSQPANYVAPPRSKRARLDVDPATAQEKENEVKMTDARSLSGGERSFSTVAFVLALWHHCVSPFKLMDEIDVFMDMVTRRVSYNALIRFAQVSENPGQFIFFSPLELPKIDNSDSLLRVFEMPAIIRKRPIVD